MSSRNLSKDDTDVKHDDDSPREMERPSHYDRSRPPASPRTEEFRKRHAPISSLQVQAVASTWEDVMSASDRKRKRPQHQRSMTLSAQSKQLLRFGQILNELVQVKGVVEEKDKDLQLAAEIGQMLLEKNQRIEDVCVELHQTIERNRKEMMRLEKQCDIFKHHAQELVSSNEKLLVLRKYPEEELDSVTLTDFLKAELDGKDGSPEYTGDAQADLINFRRKIRQERKQAQYAAAQHQESYSTLSDEKDELLNQIKLLKSQAGAHDELVEKNAELQQQIHILNEKSREQNIEHMAIMKRQKQAIEAAQATEARVLKQLADLERQMDMMRFQHIHDAKQADAAIRALEEELQRAADREAQLKRELEQLRAEHETALKQLSAGASSSTTVVDEEQLNELKQKRLQDRREYDSQIVLLREANKELTRQLQKCTEEKLSAEATIIKLKKKLESFKEVGMSLRAVIEKEKEKGRRIAANLQKYRQESAMLERKIELLEKQLKELEDMKEKVEEKGETLTKEMESKLNALQKEKATLEVQLMIARRQDDTKQEIIKKKDEEIKAYKMRTVQLAKDHKEMEQKFAEIEKHERAKIQAHHDTINKITKQLQIYMVEYSKEKQEKSMLQDELKKLRDMLDDADDVKSAKSKYKTMGKKMLKAMKQMDQDMKEMVGKLEEAQKEIKAAHKENRKLQRKNDELKAEMEMTEKQMNKLMRICITGAVNETDGANTTH